jgi:hypothetical protein
VSGPLPAGLQNRVEGKGSLAGHGR